MSKILNVNDLCDAISGLTLDDAIQRVLIDALETSVAHAAKVLADHYGVISEHAEYEPAAAGSASIFARLTKARNAPT